MARIQDLPSATQITNTDLFVLLQGGEARKLSGEAFKQYIAGHGGIASIALNADYTLTFTYTDGQSDTLGPIRGQPGLRGDPGISPVVELVPAAGGTTLRITDATGTQEAFIANGTGAGDMLSSIYDENGDVASAGGIVPYVAAETQEKVDKAGGAMNSYLTTVNGQVRNIHTLPEGTPLSDNDGMDGDICIFYEV